ncbi:hypothetical protein D3C81_1916790 [compost metagenome]
MFTAFNAVKHIEGEYTSEIKMHRKYHKNTVQCSLDPITFSQFPGLYTKNRNHCSEPEIRSNRHILVSDASLREISNYRQCEHTDRCPDKRRKWPAKTNHDSFTEEQSGQKIEGSCSKYRPIQTRKKIQNLKQ